MKTSLNEIPNYEDIKELTVNMFPTISYNLYPFLPNLEKIEFNFVKFKIFPKEIFMCKNLKSLIINRTDISDSVFEDQEIVFDLINTQLVSVKITYCKLTKFPYNLLLIPTLKVLNLNGNNITSISISDDVDYRDIKISMHGQYLEMLPDSGIFTETHAQYCNLDKLLDRNQSIKLGPSEEWLTDNADAILDCCKNTHFYTLRGDRIINMLLRSNKLPPEIQDFYEILMNAFNNVASLPTPLWLFRGIDPNIIISSKDNVIIDKGFSSFTFDKNVAYRFSKHILVWNLDTEIKGLYFDSRYGTSRYDENEILLGPGIKLKIDNIIEDSPFYYYIVSFVGYENINVDRFSSFKINFPIEKYLSLIKNGSYIIGEDVYLQFTYETFSSLFDTYKTGDYMTVFTYDPHTIFFTGNFYTLYIASLNAVNTAYKIIGNIEPLFEIKPTLHGFSYNDDEFIPYIKYIKNNTGEIVIENNVHIETVTSLCKGRNLLAWSFGEEIYDITYESVSIFDV